MKNQTMGKLRYLVAGAALGAAAIFLGKKENRDKLSKKARELKKLAEKEGAAFSRQAKVWGNKAETEVKEAGAAVVKTAAAAKRKAAAALKAAKRTK